MKRARWFRTRGRDGCGYLVLTCVFSCVFLVINAALVSSFCAWFEAWGPRFPSRDHVIQIALVVAPLLMVFGEWWLFDVLVTTISSLRGGSGKNRT